MNKPERKLFSLYLTEDERQKLQQLAERDGFNCAAPWLRRFIRQAGEQHNEQKERLTAQAVH